MKKIKKVYVLTLEEKVKFTNHTTLRITETILDKWEK